ncbi:LIM1_Isl and LIM2_Isl domain-containing protein tup isoform X2 [Arctopsyche grandis]|uniref:LIM1_Isl and LIM2_Isl domain-containing protein tup isoform X2 n=1 Tax=Arctopsyche grandis TaxID=121162 RepID=UPI00406D8601
MVMASAGVAGAGGAEGGLRRAPHLQVQPSLLVNTRHHLDCDILPKKLRLSLCVGCGGQIHDQYILRVAPDLEWHAACLKCQECRQFLDESCTCFVRDGKTYCKRDYTRLFGTKCDKCGNSFNKNDFVMRAKTKIYHIECFRCCACTKQLIPGDEFALRDGGALYCKEDHEAGERATGSAAGRESNNNTSLSNNNHSSGPQELASMSDSGSESGSHKGGARGKGTGSASGGSGGDGKPTRVRTVLNEKQLHTLRTCYAANPRPDALMKEQLVEMTSLSPRVIRVWFQNKRCKDKKKTIQMKLQMQQEKEGRKLGYGGMQGVALVAGSPVRHDSPLGLAPLEVTAYQPPWKALSDFALHTDLDQGGPPHGPAFQHLVNQMHGYDLGNMHQPPPPLHPPMMQDALVHPDSADSYVTYLESDDSMPASP